MPPNFGAVYLQHGQEEEEEEEEEGGQGQEETREKTEPQPGGEEKVLYNLHRPKTPCPQVSGPSNSSKGKVLYRRMRRKEEERGD